MTTLQQDRRYMKRALTLARMAWGRTAPNPMVGAVVVKNGKIVGEGYHHKAGLPHAEVNALNNAAFEARGATIYVTLEPCSTYGRTPPCTEAIKRAGISRVVCASEDFNPQHAGKGFDILRNAGIEVQVGICRKEALELNKAFFSHITRKRPYVLLKMARDAELEDNNINVAVSRFLDGILSRIDGVGNILKNKFGDLDVSKILGGAFKQEDLAKLKGFLDKYNN